MKIFQTFLPKRSELEVIKEDDKLITYDSFLLVNAMTKSIELPEFDRLYYETLEKQLEHLLYKFREGWIKSDRQVMLSTDECISTIHFNFDHMGLVHQVNVFQRSSNLNNLEEDVQFFNYFFNEILPKYNEGFGTIEYNHFISNPHIYKETR